MPCATFLPSVLLCARLLSSPFGGGLPREWSIWARGQGKRFSGKKIGDFRFHLAFRPMMPSEEMIHILLTSAERLMKRATWAVMIRDLP